MSKYEPLRRRLESLKTDRIRLGFDDIERLLGFDLPRSAREYRPWWSNSIGGNVAIRAWREAGWKTADVDMAGERVTFVREHRATGGRDHRPAAAGVEEHGAPFDDAPLVLHRAELSRSAARLVDETAAISGVSKAAAVAKLLDEVVLERRRRIFGAIRGKTGSLPPGSPDSVELIRQDRNRDER
jgi:hypothetical protein